ncbi:MAG: class I SAM-dependent methyltransferase, partial [Flavitalea sp.]
GGAKEVVTVDLSKTYLDWAQRNFQLNGLLLEEEPGKPVYRFIHADVLQYLKTVEPRSFDLIILDPPTFSNSKRMDDTLDIQRDHVALINDCIKGLNPGGIIYFSTNFTRFVLEKEKIKKAEIFDYTKRTTPFDFEARIARYCYLIRPTQ